MILYGYWRSSAAYRVRITLALKGIAYESRPVNLRDNAQIAPDYRVYNPQARVPLLVDGEIVIAQSLAIIDYLEDTHPAPPLLPADPAARARVRSAAQIIACDVHPLGNLSVLRYLHARFGADQSATNEWAAHWIAEGFAALEAMAGDGPYLLADSVTLADVCLVPQMMNARRFGVDLARFPRLVAADAALCALAPFQAARPERQPDANG